MTAAVSSVKERLRRLASSADALLVAVAVVLGLPSLFMPFGHDQGLYYYVGREWLKRGSIPYRDVFDHKTPGLYVLHFFTILVFGENTWGIRVADLACVLALGVAAARLATPRGEAVRPGITGLGCAIAAVLHFGFFNYWDTAQSEIWYTTLAVVGAASAVHVERPRRAAVVAGVLSAIALIMKPPAAGLVAVVFACVAWRGGRALSFGAAGAPPSWRARLVASVEFAAGFLAVFALMFGYFGAHGALPAMRDIVVGANRYYVAHEHEVTSRGEVLTRFHDVWRIFFPVSIPFVFGAPVMFAVAWRRRSGEIARRYGLVVALLGASVAGVFVQYKFYWIHWLAVIGPISALLTALGADAVASAVRMVKPPLRRFAGWMPLAPALVVFGCFVASEDWGLLWMRQAALAWEVNRGVITRRQFAHEFEISRLYYFEDDIEAVSDYINSHSNPDDTICVRGFNPEVYVLTGKRYAGRFFWTNFIVDPRRAYRREEYLAEDRDAFARSRPRYVVTLIVDHSTLNGSDYYLPLGYVRRQTFGMLELMERAE